MSRGGPLVVITREDGAGEEIARALERHGLRSWHVPAIAIEPSPEPGDLDRALAGASNVDWVVFTSPKAVDVTCSRRAWRAAWELLSSRARVAVVGPGTAARAVANGMTPAAVADDAIGRGLPAAIARVSGTLEGVRVLWPRGDRARTAWAQALERDGARVVAPVAYCTCAVPVAALSPLAAAIAERRVAAVTFFSPSSAESLARAFDGTLAALRDATAIAAIGATTADALEALGARPDVVAREPTPEALAEALARHLL